LIENKPFDLNSRYIKATKQSVLIHLLKSPSIPLYKRGMKMGSPLWKRGVRGDFVKILDSIRVVAPPFIGGEFRIFIGNKCRRYIFFCSPSPLPLPGGERGIVKGNSRGTRLSLQKTRGTRGGAEKSCPFIHNHSDGNMSHNMGQPSFIFETLHERSVF